MITKILSPRSFFHSQNMIKAPTMCHVSFSALMIQYWTGQWSLCLIRYILFKNTNHTHTTLGRDGCKEENKADQENNVEQGAILDRMLRRLLSEGHFWIDLKERKKNRQRNGRGKGPDAAEHLAHSQTIRESGELSKETSRREVILTGSQWQDHEVLLGHSRARFFHSRWY